MNEYVAQPMSLLCMWIFGLGLVSTAISLLSFAQFAMRRIEKQIKEAGRDTHQPLDFAGSKIVTYAYAIVLPERFALRLHRLIDAQIVRDYSNKTDWVLGLFFIVASHLWIILTMLCFYSR